MFKILSNTLRKNKQCFDKYVNAIKTSGMVSPQAVDLRVFLRDDVSIEVLAAKAEESIFALFNHYDMLSVETLLYADQTDLDMYLKPFDMMKYNEVMLLRSSNNFRKF